jgi:hypothetical protein
VALRATVLKLPTIWKIMLLANWMSRNSALVINLVDDAATYTLRM